MILRGVITLTHNKSLLLHKTAFFKIELHGIPLLNNDCRMQAIDTEIKLRKSALTKR